VADVPVGLSAAQVIAAVANMKALGQINNIPPPQLDPIIAEFKKSLELKPGTPVGPPTPPPTP